MSSRDELIEELVDFLSDHVNYNEAISKGDLTEIISEVATIFELSEPTAKACTLEALAILKTH
jgi:hypothetical protein